MTLTPGVHEPGDAPWFQFECEGCTTVVKQWMNEAAEVFGQQLSNQRAGGECRVEINFMSLDGMSGHYTVHMDHHPNHPVNFVVHRGNIMEQADVEKLQAERGPPQ